MINLPPMLCMPMQYFDLQDAVFSLLDVYTYFFVLGETIQKKINNQLRMQRKRFFCIFNFFFDETCLGF